MKICIILLTLFLILSCDKINSLVDDNPDQEEVYLAPVIVNFDVIPKLVTHGDTVKATVSAENPETGILTYEWEVTPAGGTFLQPIDTNVVYWVAPFSNAYGSYQIKAIVYNGKKEATSSPRSITVESTVAPIVNITGISPEKDTFVQGELIVVHAIAYHVNSIRKVWLYANSTLVDSSGLQLSNEYDLTFPTDNTYLGRTELSVIAEANTEAHSRGGHAVFINIAGILTKERSGQK